MKSARLRAYLLLDEARALIPVEEPGHEKIMDALDELWRWLSKPDRAYLDKRRIK